MQRTTEFTEDCYTLTHSVQEEHHNMRLDNFMMQFMGTLSREFIKSKIKKGEIIISNRTPPHKSSTKVHVGDIVTMKTYRKHLEDVRALTDYHRARIELGYQDRSLVSVEPLFYQA